ncbi:MAG: carbohydrate-binding protein [Bacteroidota bacterium]
MKKSMILSLLLIWGGIMYVHGQGFLRVQGQDIVDENGEVFILRGMGLGGWMVQEGYMLQTADFANPQHKIRAKIEETIGATATQEFYEAWLTNHVQKIDIDSLKSWGFNSVRLPMHYNLYTLPIEDEPVQGQHTWLTKGFELTDSVISWCKQNEMYVVLDLHAAPGGQGYDAGISDYDDTKPSLWESKANRDKMVALWKRLAERYKDEPWVAGYDLLNEPNWNLPGGTLLRQLYVEVTDSIRTVDADHIIFIEGNWFANDFTGLTPPWDNQMVYSPHKYWSLNDRGSIQWVLTIRNNFNRPLYLGESGENSNVWFRDAIRLLEDNNIGWAWWPMKKVESIAGPLSAVKTPDYEALLNFWRTGAGSVNADFAKSTLMTLADNFKMANCVQQPDVRDAMFRQVYSEETKPFKNHSIPGVIHAPDFNMGRNGFAYFDNDAATYHVSTGNYTAWNRGWAYRNDGVDIEPCQDNVNTNGFNVGWISEGEWMEYNVEVTTDGVYDVNFRMATPAFEGAFHLQADGGDISDLKYIPSSGGYQTWQTVTLSNVILTQENQKLRFYSDGNEYNFNSMEFVRTGPTTDVPTEFLSATTVNERVIQLNLNKPLNSNLPTNPSDFEIFVNGVAKTITQYALDGDNNRIIYFTLDHKIDAREVIRMSYGGSQIEAKDGTILQDFTQEEVQNDVPILHTVPGRVESEDYFFQLGVNTENTTDNGRGKNIGNLDQGDYLDYMLRVPTQGTYDIRFRTAAPSEQGEVKILRVDRDGIGTLLGTYSFDPTGGWQTWTTTSGSIKLPHGEYQLRVEISKAQFNMNWFEFSLVTSNDELEDGSGLNVFPNPGKGLYMVETELENVSDVRMAVYDMTGKEILQRTLKDVRTLQAEIDLQSQPNGMYMVRLENEAGQQMTTRILKE